MASALTALKLKGETPDEIVGAASALLSNAKDFQKLNTMLQTLSVLEGMAMTLSIYHNGRLVAAACGLKIATWKS